MDLSFALSAMNYLLNMFPDVIIHPVVNVSTLTLTLFIRYPYYWNLQFLNNAIIIKTKVLLSQSYVTLPDLIYVWTLWLYFSHRLLRYIFPIILRWASLVKAISINALCAQNQKYCKRRSKRPLKCYDHFNNK